jgi:hypothetical protein
MAQEDLEQCRQQVADLRNEVAKTHLEANRYAGKLLDAQARVLQLENGLRAWQADVAALSLRAGNDNVLRVRCASIEGRIESILGGE